MTDIPLRLASVIAIFALVAGCGGGGGGGGADDDWYYHYICNGDSACESTGFAGPEGSTDSLGPGQGGQSSCNSLMNFGEINWNIPPAAQWCDHVATIPSPIVITNFTPDTGAPGSSVTITGTGFPGSASSVTVKLGDVTVSVTSINSTHITFTVPTVGNGNYPISVTTARRAATASGTFAVAVPHPLGSATIKKIASGVNHACAILADDTVKCWGANASGQLGNGSTSPASGAVVVTGLSNAIDIAAGNELSCAVVGSAPAQSAGSVMCWGLGSSGQLGNNAYSNSSSPVAAGSMTTATQVTARAHHACALLSNGGAMCWGAGTVGQLGNNQTSDSPVPVAVATLGPDNYDVISATTGEVASTKAFQISAGDIHTCARVSTSAGSDGLGVKCWGSTNNGEVGNGSPMCQVNTICDPKPPQPIPRRVTSVTTAAFIAAGGHHTCVALTSGGVYCWGGGAEGQLGYGGQQHSATPINVGGVSGVTHVTGGAYFACASSPAGLKCWGDNSAGQLGTGGTTDSPSPVTTTAIGAGEYAPETLLGGDLETCMKKTDGTAFCFP